MLIVNEETKYQLRSLKEASKEFSEKINEVNENDLDSVNSFLALTMAAFDFHKMQESMNSIARNIKEENKEQNQ